MHCDIYKFSKKSDVYCYIARPGFPDDAEELVDALEVLPKEVRNSLGRASFVMHLDLSETPKLARVDIEAVRRKLDEQGYYLQWPPLQDPSPSA
jgi:uncharacterized protein YcgL (UPF0745 family)